MVRRIRTALPQSWFHETAPTLTRLLTGPAEALSQLHRMIMSAARQARLSLADGAFLDAVARDFLGSRLVRRKDEGDDPFRHRVSGEILRERGTRNSVIQSLGDLTGRQPVVFEPRRPGDTGAWSMAGGGAQYQLGYGMAGGWGNLHLPFQCFVTAYRPIGTGGSPGVGWGEGGYSTGYMAYAELSVLRGRVTDEDLVDCVRTSLPVATIAWVRVDT